MPLPKDGVYHRTARITNKAKRRRQLLALAGDLGYCTLSDMLRDMYVERRMNIANLARSLWTSYSHARELLAEHNIPIRELGARLHNKRVVMTRELVAEISKDGIGTVASRLNVDQSTLRYHLERYVAIRATRSKVSGSMQLRNSAPTDANANTTQERAAPTVVEEPEPELYVRGYRVTEKDVEKCLRGLGDDVLAEFKSGKMPKREAYAMTQSWLRNRRR